MSSLRPKQSCKSEDNGFQDVIFFNLDFGSDVWEADLRNLDSWSLQWFVYWITVSRKAVASSTSILIFLYSAMLPMKRNDAKKAERRQRSSLPKLKAKWTWLPKRSKSWKSRQVLSWLSPAGLLRLTCVRRMRNIQSIIDHCKDTAKNWASCWTAWVNARRG